MKKIKKYLKNNRPSAKRRTIKFYVNILLIVSISLFISSSCAPSEDYIHLFQAKSHAPSLQVEDIKNLKHMGSKLVDNGINFNVYSAKATRIEVLLFNDPNSNYPSQVYEMSRLGNVWSIFIEGIAEKQYYGYRAWGPNWTYNSAWYPGSQIGFLSDVDSGGNRFNPNKVLMDPYARAYHRKHNWGSGMAASGPYREESTVAAASKSIVIKDGTYNWSSTEQTYWSNKQDINARTGREKIIKYEVNLKGISKGAVSGIPGVDSMISHPGTFRGAGEMAGYLKELGITAVEFLPVHEAGSDGGYWKYWTLGFFAPEYGYSYMPSEGSQVDEFRWMVEQYHKQDIQVILDVVFNHTGEGGLWREKVPKVEGNIPTDPNDPNNFWSYDPPETATILSYRGLDNSSYYALTGDHNDYYYDHTGTGNMLRTANLPVRQLVIDSLKYWVEEMHVDGYRFDLAEVLDKMDGQDTGNWNSYRIDGYSESNWSDTSKRETAAVTMWAVNDATLQKYNTALIAEPWSIGGYRLGDFPKSVDYDDSSKPYAEGYAWYEWSDVFKKFARKFINEDDEKLNSDLGLGQALTGSSDKFQDDGRKPYHNINKITAHDGFTMYDLLSYANKRNGIGPLNPEGVDPYSGDSDQNFSRDWGADEGLKRQMHRNLLTLLFISNGTPMMLGGDEWMRTQFGNNNAYTTGADNQYNWYRWGVWLNDDAAYRMFDFTKKIIQFRKDHCHLFCRTDYTTNTFKWRKADDSGDADAGTWSSENIGVYHDNPGTGNKKVYIAINMEENSVDFNLPAGTWLRKFDTQKYFEGIQEKTSGNVFTDTTVIVNPYGVPARTIRFKPRANRKNK